jgi:hypothetical protein
MGDRILSVSDVKASCRERALGCYRVFFGTRPAQVDGVRDLLERAIRWRRLAEAMRDPELAAEMRTIADSYVDLAERAQHAKNPSGGIAAAG